MHAKRLYENDPSLDMSNSKLYVAALIILQARALAYYHVLAATDVIWTDKVPTAATDGIYIYINPAFFRKLENESQRAFLLAHEVGHIVLKHPFRGRFYRKRGYFAMQGSEQVPYSPKGWNHAGDYVINADLIAHGLEFIPVGLLRDSIGRDDLVDSVYMDLYAEHKQKQKQEDDANSDTSETDDSDPSEPTGDTGDTGDTEPTDTDTDSTEGDESEPEGDGDEGDADPEGGDDSADDGTEDASGGTGDDDSDDDDLGSGDGDGGDPFDDTLSGEPHDEHLEPEYDGTPEEQEEQAGEDNDEISRRVDEAIDAVNDANERGEHQPGTSKAFTKGGNRHAGGDAAYVDWTTALIDRVTRVGSEGEACWSRIHRRRWTILGILTPSYKGTFDRLALSVDISGSVSRPALTNFLRLVAMLIDDLQPASGCLVMFTNTEVVETHEVFSGGELLDLEVPEGGGTTMGAAVEYMEENGLEADVHLCFTDGALMQSDMQFCADNDVVMVLDRVPSSYRQMLLDRTGIEYIVACDQAA